jgi:predicted DNA binding CopG/RHH family protein
VVGPASRPDRRSAAQARPLRRRAHEERLVRLPVTDIERARKLAGKRGVGYQTLIKTLLREALKKESKIA